MHVGVGAGVEDDRCFQASAKSVPQCPEATKIFTADLGASFDLECDDLPVVTFEYEVDLISAASAEVPRCHGGVPPAHLLEDLTDRERF